MRASTLVMVSLLVPTAACVSAQDDPTTVHDLRVLGMGFEPPEVLLTRCNALTLRQLLASQADGGSVANVDPGLLIELLSVGARPLDFRALIADPNGAGRALDYKLSVCTDATDRTCSNPDRRSVLSEGQYSGESGELSLKVSPVSSTNDAGMVSVRTVGTGTPVLLDVVQNDSYRGLGGIRIPVVLELTARDTGEKIFAQKLMPYVCRFLPQMEQNVLPVLPGMTARSEAWAEDQVIELGGRTAIDMEPLDFSALEETYVLPSLQLQPVTLTESWKIAHYATSGTISPYETGGTNLGGAVSRANFKWTSDAANNQPIDIRFYFVVRDGRGGESWLVRRARWSPL